MPASPLDSAIYRDLFADREVSKLFTDSAEVRALLIVEGALAKAQGALGVIPELSAAAIQRASLEVQIDPGSLAKDTSQSAVVVPALVAAFRDAMEAPEHSQFIHWGATSQDIMDTALILRLRQVLTLFENRLVAILNQLAQMAESHAYQPMAARTYGQIATPTTFGAVVSSWGAPVLDQLHQMESLRSNLLKVSLSGAAGTLSVLGDQGPETRARFAENLGLLDPEGSWHSNRSAIAGFAGWMTLTATALGKIAEDVLRMTQSGIDELRLGTSGGSSTMPQKSNPVAPSVIKAQSLHMVSLNATMQTAALHPQQRDGASWFLEWLSLPQMCDSLGGILKTAESMLAGLAPNPDQMKHHIDPLGTGVIYAEALSFLLAAHMPRPEAQAKTKELCTVALDTQTPLVTLAAQAFPAVDFSAISLDNQLGNAPDDAIAFAKKVRNFLSK